MDENAQNPVEYEYTGGKVWYNVYIMIHGKFKNCTHSLMGKASERCRFLAE